MVINPLEFPQWDALLASHPGASFFHSSAWARVLGETYGHSPAYFCRFAGSQLRELLALMEVSSPFTGKRGVSVPFADFCLPLSGEGGDLHLLYEFAANYGLQKKWRYIECRGGGKRLCAQATPSLAFFGHLIDLAVGEEQLFKRLESAVRRGVRKAHQHGLRVEFSTSLQSVETYYALHCRTRRHHGVPPQPFRFFKNIHRHVIGAGRGFVALARSAERPVAGAVFFYQGRHALYKFGASDLQFQQLRPNNLLMWEAIKYCAENGFADLHLGRTSLSNEGLRRFKRGFGAAEERIEYTKHDLLRGVFVTDVDRAVGPLNILFRTLPLPLLRLLGKILYRHMS